MSISSHAAVIAKVNEINFEEDCLPDQSFFLKFFSVVGGLTFCNTASWTTGEKSSTLIFTNRSAFRWIWNQNQTNRTRFMDRFESVLCGQEKAVSQDVKNDILNIVDQVFSSLESGKDFDTERVIVYLNKYTTSKKSHLVEYSKYKLLDSSLASIWKDSGIEHSKEPEFFELLWSELKRSSGYVDSQKRIIAQCAKNCEFIPDSIVESLKSGGYDSVKGYLVRHLCEIIKSKRSKLSYNVANMENDLNRAYSQVISIVPNIKNSWEFSPDSVIDALPKEHLIWVAQQIRDSGSRWVISKLEEKLTS